jgi:hypothetical protein
MLRTARRFLGLIVGLVLMAPTGTRPALAQSANDLQELRKEIEGLKEGQETIQKELREIKGLLQGVRAHSPRPAEDIVLNIDGAPYKGAANARLTLVEFSDYECPFCGRHFRQTLPRLERDYIDTGKLKYVFLNFPIDSLHPKASIARVSKENTGKCTTGFLPIKKRWRPKSLYNMRKRCNWTLQHFRHASETENRQKRSAQTCRPAIKPVSAALPPFSWA